MDIAAGFNRKQYKGNRPIIAVQLPQEVVRQVTGAGLESSVLDAVKYILERAKQLSANGPRLPVVINLSYGENSGPHDGTTAFEQTLQTLLSSYRDNRKQKATMVISSGNHHLSKTHGEIELQPGSKPVELDWQVLPDDKTTTRMEVWLPYDQSIENGNRSAPLFTGDKRIELSVTSPDGKTSPLVPSIDGSVATYVVSGTSTIVAQVIYRFMFGVTARGVYCISLLPTFKLAGETLNGSNDAVAPSGQWKVTIHPIELTKPIKINAWINRDDQIYGYPLEGRQSTYVNACYEEYDPQGKEIIEDNDRNQDCIVRSRALINGIATGDGVIVAGAYIDKDKTLADYSAGGPITPSKQDLLTPPRSPVDQRKPDAVALADDSAVHFGLPAAGSMSGSVKLMNGTSVAAPMATRFLAEQAAILPGTDGRPVIAQKATDYENLNPTLPALNNERSGFGRIQPTSRRIMIKRVE